MTPTNHRVVVYDLSLEMARKCHAVVGVLRRNDAELADQLHRASVCVVLNVAEGRGRWGKDARRFFRIALGSKLEVCAGLDPPRAFGWLDGDCAADELNQIGAMLDKLAS
jgi:four helix bundle protein